VVILPIARLPAGFWMLADPRRTWETVAAEIVLVTSRIPMVAVCVAWTDAVLR
jgi:hypothetical protein